MPGLALTPGLGRVVGAFPLDQGGVGAVQGQFAVRGDGHLPAVLATGQGHGGAGAGECLGQGGGKVIVKKNIFLSFIPNWVIRSN